MKKKLDDLRLQAGILRADYDDDMKWGEMKKNGETLPDDVFEDHNGKLFRLLPSELSPEEEMLFVQLKQLRYIKAIRNCAIFFVVLAVIGILLLLGGGF